LEELPDWQRVCSWICSSAVYSGVSAGLRRSLDLAAAFVRVAGLVDRYSIRRGNRASSLNKEAKRSCR
jgi:hypothetical protein